MESVLAVQLSPGQVQGLTHPQEPSCQAQLKRLDARGLLANGTGAARTANAVLMLSASCVVYVGEVHNTVAICYNNGSLIAVTLYNAHISGHLLMLCRGLAPQILRNASLRS